MELSGLTVLVNNAGEGIAGPLETSPIDSLRHQFDVNVIGQVLVTRHALPLLRRGEADGRVVFVGSVSGLVAAQFAGAYHASKYAIEAIGDVWRQELAPDGSETLRRQCKNGARPQSIAELIEHAVSASRPRTRYVTGPAATVVPKRCGACFRTGCSTTWLGVPPPRRIDGEALRRVRGTGAGPRREAPIGPSLGCGGSLPGPCGLADPGG